MVTCLSPCLVLIYSSFSLDLLRSSCAEDVGVTKVVCINKLLNQSSERDAPPDCDFVLADALGRRSTSDFSTTHSHLLKKCRAEEETNFIDVMDHVFRVLSRGFCVF